MANSKKNIVVVGGGTGTHTVLKGLKRHADRYAISAVVTMADSGGSTGRLRDEFGQLPVGDVRMALTALAADAGAHDELLRELFLYRFHKGEGLAGHTFGNLLLTALTDILGSEVAAIESASRILQVHGTVLPVSTDNIHLQAEYDDGVTIIGEHHIDEPQPDRHHRRIKKLSLVPAGEINPAAAAHIKAADVVVFGPGDLYTSILANTVVSGFREALAESGATVVYICNLMTRPGQTIGMTAAEHVHELVSYIGKVPDYVIVNATPLPADLLERYAAEETYPVDVVCHDYVCEVVSRDLLASEEVKTVRGDKLRRSLIRHDPHKLTEALLSLIESR
jgi:uncharacterized cofD-like protein